jgi:hypothetical protein
MAQYKRIPMKSIEEFKWHTKIIKTFGKKALMLYTAFPRTGAPVDEEQIKKLIDDEQSRNSIMEFMIDNGLIELAEGVPAGKPRAAPKEEIAPEAEEEKPEEEIAPSAPKAGKRRLPEKKEEEEENVEIVPAYEEEEKPAEEEAPAEEAPEEEQPKRRYLPQKKEEEEIAPEVEEEKPAEEEAPAEEAPEEEQPKRRYLPQKKEEEEEKPAEEEAPAEEAPEQEKPEEEAAPEEAPSEEITSEQEETTEEEKGPSLTPAEMIVHDKYGEQGVLIFRLIDGKRSVAEVAKESGTSQDKVMEVLKYLDEVGLISLGGAAGGTEKGTTAAAETQEEKFAPLSEDTEASPITIDEQKEGVRMAKLKPGAAFISKMKIKMSVVFKFGKSGREVLEYLESRKEANAVHLVIRLNAPINNVEAILAYLKAENYLDLSFMQRDEIRKEFGYDAYIMYKRYGKKGVIFYEVIDKEIPLKKIAELISEKDPAKIIEIFKLIRDVLGIDLPINEEAIKRELFSA